MVEYKDIVVGKRVVVKGGFGTEPEREVTVTGKERDVKSGYAGIDYLEDDGRARWAYLDQVVRLA